MKRSRLFYSLSVCAVLFAVAQAITNLLAKAAWQAVSAATNPTLPAQAVKPAATTATFTVNTADDHDDTACTAGDCTLREAFLAANANPGADTIAFAIGKQSSIMPGTAL
jgi:CSLREA domain-containing protein